MHIPLEKLEYTFQRKPLLVGGKAMEYYGLRPSGADIDFIADPADVFNLIQRYPHRVKDLWGDLGVCPFEFEIWKSICLLTYPDLCEHALDEGDFLVVSLEKLLLLKALAMRIEKYRLDAEMIVNHLLEKQYRSYDQVQAENAAFIAQVPGIVYIEKSGPGQ
ncbi:MAG TPA: hypothetical protein PJ988_16355 [Anaerolinea sp.]|nr:hypothetical protein [Anaerolinea sp.]